MMKLVVLTRLLERGDDEVGADILHFKTRDGDHFVQSTRLQYLRGDCAK